MNVKIKALNPELALTFTEFLGDMDFGHAPHWSTCFCRFYQTSCGIDAWKVRTGEENRQEAIEEIKLGEMKGYLAFDEDQCIGWCNANDVRAYTRLTDDLDHLIKDKKVGCVICYVIHPEYRKRGIARLLLAQALEDFKEQGFEAVIALPVDDQGQPEKLYRGTWNMYMEKGFQEIEKDEQVSIMWKTL